MSIASTSSSLTASYTAQTSSSASNGPGSDPIGQLLKAIKSGNLAAAKAAYQNVLDHAPGKSDSASSASSSASGSTAASSSDPLQQLISDVGTALSSGDITSAQSLVSNFQASQPDGSAPPPPPSDGAGGGTALGSAIGSLLSSVQSGDLSSAQSAYATVTSLLGDSASSSSSSSSSTSTTSSNGNPLLQLVDTLGSSLSNGDISGAQDALSAFTSGGRTGLAYTGVA